MFAEIGVLFGFVAGEFFASPGTAVEETGDTIID